MVATIVPGSVPIRRSATVKPAASAWATAASRSGTSTENMLFRPGGRWRIGLSGVAGPSSSNIASPIRSCRTTTVGEITSPTVGMPSTSSQKRQERSRSGATAAR